MIGVMACVYAANAVLAAIPAVLTWRRRRVAALAGPVGMVFAGIAWWSAVQAFSYGLSNPTLRLAFHYALYLGVSALSGGYVWYARAAVGLPPLPPRIVRLLCVEPVAVLITVATDPWHHLFYLSVNANVDVGSPLGLRFGPLFWAHIAYCYVVTSYAFLLIGVAARRAVAAHRRVLVTMLIAAIAPSAAGLLFLAQNASGIRTADYTPIAFLVPGASWWWLLRRGASDPKLVPVAYRRVLAVLGDAVMVLDVQRRILDVNPAATQLLRFLRNAAPSGVIGGYWQDVVGPDLADVLGNGDQQTVTTGAGTVLDVRVVRINSERQETEGIVVVVRDVTELEHLRVTLTEQATRDALTGVHNRRYLTETLDREFDRVRWEGEPLAAVMIDIDHFKAVNDVHGHAVGDRMLQRVAQEFAAAMRPGDTLARYGGEEFVVVLPGADAATAARRAETWRELCAAIVLDTEKGPLRLTLSAGVAAMGTDDTPDALLSRADDALYAAKADGRDRVVTAPAPVLVQN
jgi:diguanylate cyclase (GGDEF)-like protein